MNMPKPHVRLASIIALVVAGTVWMVPLPAQSEPAQPSLKELIEKKSKGKIETEDAALDVPDDPLGRGTPRSSMRGYLASVRDRNYSLASQYLDLRNLPADTADTQGPELARQLRIILDRQVWIDADSLSPKPEGALDDNLHPARDRVGSISSERRTYDLFMQRIPREDGALIWKIAGVTVAEIPQLYEEFGYGRLEHFFPSWLFDVSLLGISLWLWGMLIVLFIVLYPIAMLLTSLAVRALRGVNADLAQQMEKFFSGPVTLLVWTVLGRSAGEFVGPSIALRAVGQARTVQVIALAWLLLRVIDFVAYRASKNLDNKGLTGALILLKPLSRLLKLVAVTAAVLLWLDNVGYKVTTLLAGLSISGVAVALASQKSLENIFGAVTLFTSRPVKVGDFCRFGNTMGIVEEIGLRATRIRTLERSIITIANAEFANMHLDNLSERDRFWYHPSLQLRYETTPDQMRYILVEVRTMLYAHPKILSEPLHVRFKGFGEYSLDIEVFSYIGVTDYEESLEVAEDLNLRIMDIVETAGSDFAFPSEVQYSLPGKPLDEERAKAVGLKVKEWRSKRELYLPKFPADKIAQIKGSLDYPPEGSPQYAPVRG
ncbi:MAG TPA: mechanosensitive ion channel family protein [Nitrospira sp.]|nr:mechanosensitive ion channel family protein [Nitrospira sp.]